MRFKFNLIDFDLIDLVDLVTNSMGFGFNLIDLDLID